MAVWILGHLLAVGIGISLGLVGGGGSVLAAPVLIYVMQVPSKSAFAMTLVIVGVSSLIGILPHWRLGNVRWGVAALFAPPAMVGTYLGARLAALPMVTPTLQLVTFGGMMLAASGVMIRKGQPQVRPLPAMPQRSLAADQVTLEKGPLGDSVAIAPPHPTLAIAAEGLGVGILTGFVGIGGGFLVIPALVLLGGVAMKEAVGTSLVILVLKSVTGFAGYLGHVPLDWALMASFTLAASLGIVGGAYLCRYVEARQLEKGFGYFVLAVAIFVLLKR